MSEGIVVLMTLAEGATAFRLRGDGDGGRMALDFDRSQVAQAVGAYALMVDEDAEQRLVRVTFEVAS